MIQKAKWICAAMLMALPIFTVSLIEAETADMCTQQALMAYFPEEYVRNTLKKFNVPEDKWNAIVHALQEKEHDVLKTVEAKASKMNPNPLKDPQQRQAAVKVFKETLIEIASGPLKSNGITDDSQIQSMLDDIQQQKARQFAQCIEQHRFPPIDGEPKKAPEPATK